MTALSVGNIGRTEGLVDVCVQQDVGVSLFWSHEPNPGIVSEGIMEHWVESISKGNMSTEVSAILY